MIIANGTLTRQSLAGQVVLVTGGGQGIGFEAARALAWLGAQVVIAEVDVRAGRKAWKAIADEFGTQSITFVPVDVGNSRSVERLKQRVVQRYGRVDVVLNNATLAPIGAVKDVPVTEWDASYRVNLRGPVLLAQAFLPGMLARGRGVFVCVSSTGQDYMGAYEIFKTAQVELANTLNAELEGTQVIVFTIGPGLVLTRTARTAIEQLAPMMGQTQEDFYTMLSEHTLPVEAAGAGFAAAIALAERFRGQEIGSVQALQAAGIDWSGGGPSGAPAPPPELQAEMAAIVPPAAADQGAPEEEETLAALVGRVRATLDEQNQGWAQRSLFERQWMMRNFKKFAGMSAEQWLQLLRRLEQAAAAGDRATLRQAGLPFERLASFYENLAEMAAGYIKDPGERQRNVEIVQGWEADVRRLGEKMREEVST